mgnify:CR=1 FL=1
MKVYVTKERIEGLYSYAFKKKTIEKYLNMLNIKDVFLQHRKEYKYR